MKATDGQYGEVDKRVMTMSGIKALPNMLGPIASAMVTEHGEYKCKIGDKKTWIVLKK